MEARMWTDPLDPTNPRQRTAVLALALALGAGLIVINDLALPALAQGALCRAEPRMETCR
jgi:hypothetical protein